jgi:hypothetical protein
MLGVIQIEDPEDKVVLLLGHPCFDVPITESVRGGLLKITGKLQNPDASSVGCTGVYHRRHI